MYDAFGWERPHYMHISPIMKDAQRKLSKRYGDANFEDFIAKGYLPEAIVNYIALLGWAPKNNQEKMTMQEMLDGFDVDGISHSPSIFDEAKMRWLNGEYIKELSVDEFLKLATPYFEQSKIAGKYDYRKLAELLIPRTEIFSDIPEKVNFLEEFGEFDVEMFEHKKMKITKEIALMALKKCEEILPKVENWTNDYLKELLTNTAQEMQIKTGQIFLPLRLAITAAASTPGGATEMAELLGKEETLRRLKFSIELLEKNI